jgi:hypothetical protein
MNSLGCTYLHLNRLDDAVEMLERALEMAQRVLPENHPCRGSMIRDDELKVFATCDACDLGSVMFNLSITYSALGKFEDALAIDHQVLEFRRRVLPEDHPDIGE